MITLLLYLADIWHAQKEVLLNFFCRIKSSIPQSILLYACINLTFTVTNLVRRLTLFYLQKKDQNSSPSSKSSEEGHYLLRCVRQTVTFWVAIGLLQRWKQDTSQSSYSFAACPKFWSGSKPGLGTAVKKSWILKEFWQHLSTHSHLEFRPLSF